MNKTPIFCVYNALGKTYFCQHHLKWADIDEEFFHITRAPNLLIALQYRLYTIYGYHIVTNASPYVMQSLANNEEFEPILILPSEEMKEEIIQRIRDRGDDDWANYLNEIYDDHLGKVLQTPYKKIFLTSGQYLEDVLNEDGSLKICFK